MTEQILPSFVLVNIFYYLRFLSSFLPFFFFLFFLSFFPFFSFFLSSLFVCLLVFSFRFIFLYRPDMTFAVDWALNYNYLSIYISSSFSFSSLNLFYFSFFVFSQFVLFSPFIFSPLPPTFFQLWSSGLCTVLDAKSNDSHYVTIPKVSLSTTFSFDLRANQRYITKTICKQRTQYKKQQQRYYVFTEETYRWTIR